MAESSGFFNAILSGGVYDRTYNADDYSDNLSVVVGNGVLRSINDDLKVTAAGLVLSVAQGRGWINGHYYKNDSAFTFSAVNPPTAGKRYDRVMLRLNTGTSYRRVSLVYVEGTEASTPVAPAPTRSGEIYDLVLATVFVDTNATSLVVTDNRADANLCGWVYSVVGDSSFFTSLDNSFNEWFAGARDTLSSVTLFKRYSYDVTLPTATSTVIFNIPQYDAETCFLEVYVNGIRDRRHTINNTVITFTGTLTAGTVVTVFCYKSIDGNGIMSVSDEITQLQNQMAAIQGTNKFTYTCTGANDNISLSEIAQAFYAGSYTVGSLTAAAEAFMTRIGGNTYLAGLANNAQVEISVVGRLGATTPAAGAGTSASRYRWFNIGIDNVSDKKLMFDFSKCEKIGITCSANTSNIIFYGSDLNIKGANVSVSSSAAGCNVTMVTGSTRNGYIEFENCRLLVATSGDAFIAENGTFTNCYCMCRSSASHAVCFDVKSVSLIRLIGGTYYTYIADSAKVASVMRIEAEQTNGVIIADNINCPTVSLTGYLQRNLIIANAGNAFISGVVSTMTSTGTTHTITGQIWKSKR